jgi:hypothetical protein
VCKLKCLVITGGAPSLFEVAVYLPMIYLGAKQIRTIQGENNFNFENIAEYLILKVPVHKCQELFCLYLIDVYKKTLSEFYHFQNSDDMLRIKVAWKQ